MPRYLLMLSNNSGIVVKMRVVFLLQFGPIFNETFHWWATTIKINAFRKGKLFLQSTTYVKQRCIALCSSLWTKMLPSWHDALHLDSFCKWILPERHFNHTPVLTVSGSPRKTKHTWPGWKLRKKSIVKLLILKRAVILKPVW